MACGPNLAPGRNETAVSKGIPRIAMSKRVEGSSRQRICGKCEKVTGPVNGRSICGPYFEVQGSSGANATCLTCCWLSEALMPRSKPNPKRCPKFGCFGGIASKVGK